MDFYRNLMFSVCVLWCSFENGLAAAEDGGSQETQIQNRRPRGILSSGQPCVKDFKLLRINEFDRKIEFSFRTPREDSFFKTDYDVKCETWKYKFDSYQEFDCSGLDSSKFIDQRENSKYKRFNEDYYCAVVVSDFPFKKRSNIIRVRTPGVKKSLVWGLVFFGVFAVICTILGCFFWYKRRRGMFGSILGRPEPQPTPLISNQGTVYIPPNTTPIPPQPYNPAGQAQTQPPYPVQQPYQQPYKPYPQPYQPPYPPSQEQQQPPYPNYDQQRPPYPVQDQHQTTPYPPQPYMPQNYNTSYQNQWDTPPPYSAAVTNTQASIVPSAPDISK